MSFPKMEGLTYPSDFIFFPEHLFFPIYLFINNKGKTKS
jgi:hypothetical protein